MEGHKRLSRLFSGNLRALFSNFWSQQLLSLIRSQYVKISNNFLTNIAVNHGVPQIRPIENWAFLIASWLWTFEHSLSWLYTSLSLVRSQSPPETMVNVLESRVLSWFCQPKLYSVYILAKNGGKEIYLRRQLWKKAERSCIVVFAVFHNSTNLNCIGCFLF